MAGVAKVIKHTGSFSAVDSFDMKYVTKVNGEKKMKIGGLVHKGPAWGVMFYDQNYKVGKQDCASKHKLPKSSWVSFYGW